jgi:photosystem II stability/assembly factor-like uncharacterized protein
MRNTKIFTVIVALGFFCIQAQTWHSIEPRATDQGLSDIFFADSLHGWAVGQYGAVVATTDGGLSWNAQNSTVTDTFVSVYFSDNMHGWAHRPIKAS